MTTVNRPNLKRKDTGKRPEFVDALHTQRNTTSSKTDSERIKRNQKEKDIKYFQKHGPPIWDWCSTSYSWPHADNDDIGSDDYFTIHAVIRRVFKADAVLHNPALHFPSCLVQISRTVTKQINANQWSRLAHEDQVPLDRRRRTLSSCFLTSLQSCQLVRLLSCFFLSFLDSLLPCFHEVTVSNEYNLSIFI